MKGIKRIIQVCDMNEKQKKQYSEMSGNILLWICEGQSTGYMSEKLNLYPYQVEHNINEMLYILRKRVGFRRFIRTLFIK